MTVASPFTVFQTLVATCRQLPEQRAYRDNVGSGAIAGGRANSDHHILTPLVALTASGDCQKGTKHKAEGELASI